MSGAIMAMPEGEGHNRLAAIAADVRSLHIGIRRNAEQIASDVIKAGKLLVEAKQSLAHGQWETWLREHVAISPRTARRYMRIASAESEIGHVADLGLAAAATERLRIKRIQRLARKGWAHIVKAGRQLGAIQDELGEDRFHDWARTNLDWLDGREAFFLIEVARVTDAGGDVAELLARDDGPKELRFPAEIHALERSL